MLMTWGRLKGFLETPWWCYPGPRREQGQYYRMGSTYSYVRKTERTDKSAHAAPAGARRSHHAPVP